MIGTLRAAGRALLATPRRLAWIPVVLWLTLIYWLSSRSSGDIARLGYGEWFVNLGHAPLFGLLGLWLALGLPRADGSPRGWPRIDRTGVRNVLGLVLLFGALDELHQYLERQGRSFSALDVVTDVTGASCLLLVAAYVGRPDANRRGLWIRLGAGVALCFAAGTLATFGPRWLPIH